MARKNNLEERLEILDKSRKKFGGIYNTHKMKQPKRKKKEKAPSNRVLYDITLTNFQLHLYELICEINDIPLSIYVYSDKNQATLIRNMKLNERFFELSKLRWDEPMPIDGLHFRGRFATCILYKIIRKSHMVAKWVYSEVVREDDGRNKKMRVILDQWIQTVDGFVLSYLSSNLDYQPYLLKVYELLNLAEDGSRQVIGLIHDTDELLISGNEPGIEVNNMTKMAYVLATGSLKLKRCPAYQQDFDYRNYNDVVSQVGELGYAILKWRTKEERRLPIFYDCFQRANPKIVSRFYNENEEAPEITVGLRALEFSKIFYNYKVRSNKLVDRMM